MCLSFMVCARNYLRLMWMDGEWVGVPLVARLGYAAEVWPLARGSFREVWGRVVGGGGWITFHVHLLIRLVARNRFGVSPIILKWSHRSQI